MKFQNKLVYSLIVIISLFLGCTTYSSKYNYFDGKYVKYYENRSPNLYQSTENCFVFDYKNVDLNSLYHTLFDEYYIIGTSEFEAGYENVELIKGFGRKIGADIIIASTQYTKTETIFKPVSTLTTQTTRVSGYSGGVYNSAQINSYGTETSIIPIKKDYFIQKAYFLKIAKTIPIWNLKKDDIIKNDSKFTRKVSDRNYEIIEYQVENKVFGFVVNVKDINSINEKNTVKYWYDVDSELGIYIMLNNQPQPSKFTINRFGYLEVSFLLEENVIDFNIDP